MGLRGRRAAMEDASAAVPRFAEVPARMLAGARELDALHGVGSAAAAARKLPLHLFAVYDGHGGSEVSRAPPFLTRAEATNGNRFFSFCLSLYPSPHRPRCLCRWPTTAGAGCTSC